MLASKIKTETGKTKQSGLLTICTHCSLTGRYKKDKKRGRHKRRVYYWRTDAIKEN